jgi:hypothetical protein
MKARDKRQAERGASPLVMTNKFEQVFLLLDKGLVMAISEISE